VHRIPGTTPKTNQATPKGCLICVFLPSFLCFVNCKTKMSEECYSVELEKTKNSKRSGKTNRIERFSHKYLDIWNKYITFAA